ncbi:hypothetical protein [Acrocarpospora sp. B8E8]|uniref:hypothetical protein n=1 Tax=Acrocarpospora sp. B8E8 TaxID=3153572 RepID=UPI00325D8174
MTRASRPFFTADTFISFDGQILRSTFGYRLLRWHVLAGPIEPVTGQEIPRRVTLNGDLVIRVTTRGGRGDAVARKHHQTVTRFRTSPRARGQHRRNAERQG